MDKGHVNRIGICSKCKQEKNIVFSIRLKQDPPEKYKLLCAECNIALGYCDICHHSIGLERYADHLLNDHDHEELAVYVEETKYHY